MNNEYRLMREEVTREFRRFANMVRDYSIAQKRVWQKVPWLVIEAADRTMWPRFLDAQAIAPYGLWPIGYGSHRLFVDCATGNILDDGLIRATNADLIVASSNMRELDAVAIVRRLHIAIKEKYAHIPSDGNVSYEDFARQKDADKEKMRAKYGVNKTYTRKRRLPSDWSQLSSALAVA